MAKMNFLNSIQLTRPPRNNFDLSHSYKTTMDMGELIPVLMQEVLPSDHFKMGCDTLIRFQPLVAPVFHKINAYVHYYFVPNRLLYKDWEDFITGNVDPEPVWPYVEYNLEDYETQPLIDYLGLPKPGATQTIRVSAIPFAAYQFIWDEYYRAQDLQNANFQILTSGDNTPNKASLFLIRHRGWEHDYFTASLPFAQKGPAVDIPIGDVPLRKVLQQNSNYSGTLNWTGTETPGPATHQVDVTSGDFAPTLADNELFVQGTSVEPTTINTLRRSFAIQRWFEKAARAGTRYVESILAFFGVKSDDARMQRPEYIFGTKTPVIISEVLNTTGQVTEAGDPGLPQGNMAGHGIAVATGSYGSYFAKEHGYIVGLMSVMPETGYSQGIPRHFLRDDRFEYFFPEFAHIGEQEVKNKEIYVQHDQPDGTWGYLPRGAEYRYNPSRISGDFKTSLAFWTLSRIFDSQPSLNTDFISCVPRKDIFAVVDSTQKSLLVQVNNNIYATRPIPKYGTPI